MELPVEVRREILLPSARGTVWRLLTDAEHLAGWFANEVELEARPGGRGVFRWANGEERLARVTAVDDERELSLEWEDAAGGETTAVTFTLADADEGTRVTVTEKPVGNGLQASASGEAIAGEWAWAIELLARIRVPAFARG